MFFFSFSFDSPCAWLSVYFNYEHAGIENQSYFQLLLLSTKKVLSYFFGLLQANMCVKKNIAYKQILVLTWASLTYTLVNLFSYQFLLSGFNSKLGKIPNSLQTQPYFSQIYPSWCLQATTVADPGKGPGGRPRPAPPYFRVWMTAPPYLKVWILNNILINSSTEEQKLTWVLPAWPKVDSLK